ncbi:MAG: hypothetical protein WAJ92_02610, partial [Candidatus Acidiferrales bacterium]
MHFDKRSRSLRLLLTLCALVIAIPVSLAAQSTPPTDRVRDLHIRIWLDQASYSEGAVVPVHVQITNASKTDVYLGRNMWTNDSPSRVRLIVIPLDRHPMKGVENAVDIARPGGVEDMPKRILSWCISLPSGYSYSSSTSLQNFVARDGLIPGVYKIRAIFESSGLDVNSYFNPFLDHQDQLANLLPNSWKGELKSNEVILKIASDSATAKTN